MPENIPASIQLLRALLRPIVTACVRRSIIFQDFSDVARSLFVEAGKDALASEGHEINVSRLSVLTGLQRREVSRLLSEKGEGRSTGGLLFKVLGQWRADKRFAVKPDVPRPLSFRGIDSEFGALVRSVNQDLNAYTILFELERLGMVEKRKELLYFIGDGALSVSDAQHGYELLSSDMEDLITAVDQNIASQSDFPNHHIKTRYDNIIEDAVPEIRRWLLDQGAKFHKEARKFLSKFDKDIQPRLHAKKGGARVALGSFSVTKIDKDAEESL